jgi:cell shape-determining protein MreC
MFATSGDILNMSLAIGFIILVIFLSLLIFYAILILRDVSKVMDDIEEIVTRVRTTIVQPLKAVDYIIEKAKPYIETVLERKMKEKKSKKKK